MTPKREGGYRGKQLPTHFGSDVGEIMPSRSGRYAGILTPLLPFAVLRSFGIYPEMKRWIDPIPFARDMVALEKPLRLLGRWRPPRDGLYRVATRRTVYGGFLVRRGRVIRCSPAVRKRIHIWAHTAQFIGDEF